MPVFDPFFVIFSFFSEKFSLLMAYQNNGKKSNRANVGVIVQRLILAPSMVIAWVGKNHYLLSDIALTMPAERVLYVVSNL